MSDEIQLKGAWGKELFKNHISLLDALWKKILELL